MKYLDYNRPATHLLKCISCGEDVTAMYLITNYIEFHKQLEQGNLHCECGGVLHEPQPRKLVFDANGAAV